jgi:hypothetical protein
MRCKECIFWQDYSDRVTACISAARSNMVRNRIELRRCSNIPPPAVADVSSIYTDEDFSCSGFIKSTSVPIGPEKR